MGVCEVGGMSSSEYDLHKGFTHLGVSIRPREHKYVCEEVHIPGLVCQRRTPALRVVVVEEDDLYSGVYMV